MSARKVLAVAALMLFIGVGSYFTIGVYAISAGDWVVERSADMLGGVGKSSLHYIAKEAEAAVMPSLSVEQLEAKLDAIVWGIESNGRVGEGIKMEEGEIFQTFDPPMSWTQEQRIARCLKTGGKIDQECYSFGPRQIKIPTLKSYWAKLYDGQILTDKEARDIAESNDGSRRFFLDCAEKIRGCAENWGSFMKHRTEGQIYIDLIREARGITL